MKTINVSTTSELLQALKNAKGGETILLAPGSYAGVGFSNINPASGVTIRSADDSKPAVIEHINISGSSNLNFQSMEFYADPAKDLYAFRVSASTNISFDNLDVHGTLNGSPADDTSGFLIRESSGISITNSEFQQLAFAVGFLNTNDILVQGNNFHDVRADGVRFGGSSNVVIDRNTFTSFHPAGDDHPDAIQFWTVNTTASAHNITISNNVITRGDGAQMQGIFLNDELGNRPYIDVTISNNLMVGTMYHGISVTNAQNLKVLDNQVHAYSDMKSWIQVRNSAGVEVTGNEAYQFLNTNNSSATLKNNDTVGFINPSKVSAMVDGWLAKVGLPPVVEQPAPTPTPTPSEPVKTPQPDDSAALPDPIPVPPAPPVVEAPPTPTPTPTQVYAGTAGHDNFVGATGDWLVRGSFGNDTISTNAGNDWVSGGQGDDVISTGAGNDTIAFSGPNEGYDAIDGGAGYDRIVAQADNTVIGLKSLSGVELISAEGFKNVVIRAGNANDRLDFSAVQLTGISLIDGGNGDDTIIGSAGNDTIQGNWGNDVLHGGAGDDTFLVANNTGLDTIDGGTGFDTIRATAHNTTIGWGKISGIEMIDGGGFSNVVIKGGLGADKIDLSGIKLVGVSLIDGYNGDDTIIGSAGDDVINGGYGNDMLRGGDGNDTFLVLGNAGLDTIDGGAGYDTIRATAAGTTISWGHITNIEKVDGGGFANVQIKGGLGNDLIDLSKISLQGIAAIDGNNGNDTILGSAGNDRIIGGNGADLMTGGGGSDVFVFNHINETKGNGLFDTITDFKSGVDRIDLAGIDANNLLGGDQAFRFVDKAAFSAAGDLRVDTSTIAGVTRLMGDLTGNGIADFEIRLTGTHHLTQADFVL